MVAEKTYVVTILPEAIDQLHEIIDYIKIWSSKNAKQIALEVFHKIKKLKTFPRRYSIEEYARKDKEIRSFFHKNLKIIYYIKDNEVVVLAILHSSRNPAHIAKISPE